MSKRLCVFVCKYVVVLCYDNYLVVFVVQQQKR